MNRDGFLRRWLRRLAAVVAGLLILLAVLVGIARLLLPLVPEYQDEIRRFTADATGLDVEFAGVSAGWPLQGPEIRFREVRVYAGDDRRPVFDAREFRVGLNLLQVIAERRLTPGRIGVRGARLEVERAADRSVLLNGVSVDELLRPRDDGTALTRLNLDLRDIELAVADATRLEPRAGFLVDQLALRFRAHDTDFAGLLIPRGGLGRSIELRGRAPLGLRSGREVPAEQKVHDWSVAFTGTDLDVARLLRIAMDQPAPLASGRGSLRFDGRFRDARPRDLRVHVELADAIMADLPAAEAAYQRLELRASWRQDDAGWDARLERLTLQRGQRPSPPVEADASYRAADGGRLSFSSELLPLADLWPFVRAVAGRGFRRDVLPEKLLGEIRDVDFSTGADASAAWKLQATLRDVGLAMPGTEIALEGISGLLAVDQGGGRLELDGQAGLVRLPEFFRADLRATAARGTLVWKTGPEGPELFGDDLRVTTPDGETRSRLRLSFPAGGTPLIDLRSSISASSAPAVVDYLPLKKFGPAAVSWLDRAIIGGRIPTAEIIWQGPVRGMPYEDGDGRFRAEFVVEDGTLDYAPGWPRVEALKARVVIDRTSLVSLENQGTMAGLALQDVDIRIPSFLRDGAVEIADTEQVQLRQVLGFLRQSPIARIIGPTIDSLTAGGGARAQLKVSVPFGDPDSYRVDGVFDVDRGSLGLRGTDLDLRDVNGRVRLTNTRLSAEELQGRFLDEPVAIRLRPATADEPALDHLAVIRGTTPVEKITAAFSLPYPDRLLGTIDWETRVFFPNRAGGQSLSVEVDSDLSGLLSTLAPPLRKPADSVDPLYVNLRLPERDRLEIDGWLARGLGMRLQLVTAQPRGWQVERGTFRSYGTTALRRGSPLPPLPAEPVLTLSGAFATLRYEDWIAGGSRTTGPSGLEWRSVDIDAAEFSIFGRLFRDLGIEAARDQRAWRISVTGRQATGTVEVPFDESAPLHVNLERLWLEETDPAAGEGGTDPRGLPAVDIDIGDFRMNNMNFGRLAAAMKPREDGIAVETLATEARNFRLQGDAAWIVVGDDAARQRTELRLRLDSTSIAPTLEALGYAPVVEGRKGRATIDLTWPGGPSADFLDVASGRVTVMMDQGQFLAVEPGGGRLLGLLSIAALPRRLGMDFRDVLDEGLAFDEVKGDFSLEAGNAFTCNLGLEGPVADLGVVGRVGITDRDYEQVAVARPHVSDVLALGGVVVGGPVVGGAVLLISQIFRKPLSSLGETYYQVRGSWNSPEVRRVQRGDIDVTPFRDCERYLADVLKEVPAGTTPAGTTAPE